MKSGLYIVATPIGNLGDISNRAIQILTQADIIACEDTRVTKKLLGLLGINCNKKFLTYQNYNENEQTSELIKLLQEGRTIALVSDAGSPLVSDPGYKIVHQCRENNIYVTSIPGCCAAITALQISGLPSNRFMFIGFIPNKEKARKDLFNEFCNLNSTLIFYETAPRIIKSLEVMAKVFYGREICVVRELTKLYEECISGTAEQLIEIFSAKAPKGEFVIVVSPPTEDMKTEVDLNSIIREKLKHMPLKTVVKEVVEEYKQNKNEVYDLALRIKNEQ